MRISYLNTMISQLYKSSCASKLKSTTPPGNDKAKLDFLSEILFQCPGKFEDPLTEMMISDRLCDRSLQLT
jgi:hypothetical protein